MDFQSRLGLPAGRPRDADVGAWGSASRGEKPRSRTIQARPEDQRTCDLLFRRAPAASGEVYDVLRGCPAVTQRGPRVRFTTGPIPILTRSTSLDRRLCNPLGRSLGCAAHCFAISVARARAALTATFPRSIHSLA